VIAYVGVTVIDTWCVKLLRKVVSNFDDEAERSLQHST